MRRDGALRSMLLLVGGSLLTRLYQRELAALSVTEADLIATPYIIRVIACIRAFELNLICVSNSTG